jgi:hypothetical protein
VAIKQMDDVALFDARFLLLACWVYSSTLKMGATYCTETSVYFHRTTLRYIPEDRTDHNHSCEDLSPWSLLSFQTEITKDFVWKGKRNPDLATSTFSLHWIRPEFVNLVRTQIHRDRVRMTHTC